MWLDVFRKGCVIGFKTVPTALRRRAINYKRVSNTSNNTDATGVRPIWVDGKPTGVVDTRPQALDIQFELAADRLELASGQLGLLDTQSELATSRLRLASGTMSGPEEIWVVWGVNLLLLRSHLSVKGTEQEVLEGNWMEKRDESGSREGEFA